MEKPADVSPLATSNNSNSANLTHDDRGMHEHGAPHAAPSSAVSDTESALAQGAVESEKASKGPSESDSDNHRVARDTGAPVGLPSEPSSLDSVPSSTIQQPDAQQAQDSSAPPDPAPKKKKKKEPRMAPVRAKPLTEEELAVERERQERVCIGLMVTSPPH